MIPCTALMICAVTCYHTASGHFYVTDTKGILQTHWLQAHS